MLRQMADVSSPVSLSNRFRNRRFERFERAIAALPRPLRILDVGGTNGYWESRGWNDRPDVHIVVVNLEAQDRRHDNIEPVVGDATSLASYADGAFNLIYSNSVIEHLRTLEAQEQMADEVRRFGVAYWIQTPNFWFPMEPHFLFPGWQWLPTEARVALLRRRRVGWRGPLPHRADALRAVTEIRLLSRSELARLFPGGAIASETFFGLTKSWIVTDGLQPA